jgi:pimeloyl-ACP methyl ester carboxylesterase
MPINLHYQVFGQGEPVIIMHGLLGSSRNWLSLAKKLADSYQVYTVDLRNHGRSEHADAMSYIDMAEDIAHFMKICEIGKASLIGHSMGGKVAMTFALQYRDLLDKLIVLDISPVAYQNEFDLLIESLINLPLQEVETRSDADMMLRDEITDDGMRSFLLQNLIQEGDAYSWRVNLKAIKDNLSSIGGFPAPVTINSLACPALFLGGVNSDYIQPDHHPIIRKFFSNSLIHTISNAGHWLHVEQPEKVLTHITSFLEDSGSDEPPSLLYR